MSQRSRWGLPVELRVAIGHVHVSAEILRLADGNVRLLAFKRSAPPLHVAGCFLLFPLLNVVQVGHFRFQLIEIGRSFKGEEGALNEPFVAEGVAVVPLVVNEFIAEAAIVLLLHLAVFLVSTDGFHVRPDLVDGAMPVQAGVLVFKGRFIIFFTRCKQESAHKRHEGQFQEINLFHTVYHTLVQLLNV